MSRMTAALLAGLLSVSCKMKEEQFVDQYAEAYCEWVDNCGKLAEQFGTLEDCLTNRTVFAQAELTPGGCDFSPKAAKSCVADVRDNESCDINTAMPEACTKVSSCFGDTGQ